MISGERVERVKIKNIIDKELEVISGERVESWGDVIEFTASNSNW